MDESKVSVSVEGQIIAVLNGEQFNYATHSEALLETLLLAQSALAERDKRTREWALALQSLTPGGSEYVDDPERCVEAAREGREFWRRATSEFKQQLAERDTEIARLRKVCGSSCPVCGHFLIEHDLSRDPATWERRLVLRESAQICIADITANHPDIAAEMGLTPKESPNASS